jgi:hypothetical protein
MSLKLVVGLDDVATERQVTSGWGFVALPEATGLQFERDTRMRFGGKGFHAKEFRHQSLRQTKNYTDFLLLLRGGGGSDPRIAASLYP